MPGVIEIEPSSFLPLTKIDLYDSGDERSATAAAAMTRARFHRQHHDGGCGWSNARALEAQLVALGSERDRPIGRFFFPRRR